MNHVTFLLEGDTTFFKKLTHLSDQYFSAHPSLKVQKDTPVPFNTFTCESSEMSEDETDAFVAQRFTKDKPPHQDTRK